MAKCGCAGQTCGCSLKNGTGVSITGTGTADDPFVVSVDPSSLNLATAIRTTNSSTIEFSKTGAGSVADPIIISGSLVLRSPDNSRWTISVNNAGGLSATKL